MQKGNQYLIAIGLSTACLSLLYYLSLLLHIPFAIAVVVIFSAGIVLCKWVTNRALISPVPIRWLPVIILAIGVYYLTVQACEAGEKHGGWDAWMMWNFHARYLADPYNWRKIFLNTFYDHADYPLCLPATLGFLLRLFSGHCSLLIPFLFSLLITLFIPVVIYLENINRNFIIASLTLFFFATDDFYISRGISQYADTLLAFFFLCAFICMHHAKEGKKYIALSAAFLGCGMWTKNEGAVLSLIFILFYLPAFIGKDNIKYFLAGISLPLATLMIFKFSIPNQNDMLAKQDHNTIKQLMDAARYVYIYDFFKANLAQKFNYIKFGFYGYLILCAVEKQWPDRQMFLLIACLLAYTLIYVVSPFTLDWHLATSQDRLMHQLMPAMMYVLSVRFSRIQFSLLPQKLH